MAVTNCRPQPLEHDDSAEKLILLVLNQVIRQEVQADSNGDAVHVIHCKTGDVVVGNNGSDPIILDVE